MRSGHSDRLEDLDLFAAIGIRKLRYPVLWERVSPDPAQAADWTRSDAALARIRELGMGAIVGLVHHGSGPRHTDLLADDFSTGLAAHARAAAERYPWIEEWTPVNEPVTTARFSALYGHWYPHATDERAFWRALLNQIDGTRAAMRAIRTVNPAARLIQTEDIGRTYATDPLASQAEHDNLRRWASWDLLCGRMKPDHPLWERLDRFGLGDRLRAIADDPCPPDVLGLNHYLTSDRFLDHRLERYPDHCRGESASGPLADVEAVRVLTPSHGGLEGALRETWQRYALPIAITEVHNGCTREEQMRWMWEGWTTAEALRGEGVDIRAATAWSLLGAYDWDSLLTRQNDHYECGVYDVRSGAPRPTAMVSLLRALARGETPDHPLLHQPGWWRRDLRLHYPAHPIVPPAATSGRVAQTQARPLLIVGAAAALGRELAGACRHREIPHVVACFGRDRFAGAASITDLLEEEEPWAVIDATGWDGADDGVRLDDGLDLARACSDLGIHHVALAKGSSAAAACEGLPAATARRGLVVRSPAAAGSVPRSLRGNPRKGRAFAAAGAQSAALPDLVRTMLDLVVDREVGHWNLVSDGNRTWAEFAGDFEQSAGRDAEREVPQPVAALDWTAARLPQPETLRVRAAPPSRAEERPDPFPADLAA